jgi:S-adenosylmethionine:tRNA ribosyltransferase-isomerase
LLGWRFYAARVRTSDLDYQLPEEAIAQRPVEPRHASRLLDTRDDTDHTFLELPELLRPGDLVVVNRTRVRAARLRGFKPETGGAVEVLLLKRVDEARFDALVRPARRLRAGSELRFGDLSARLTTDPVEGRAQIELDTEGDVEEAVASVGEVPLPPYIKRPLDDPERYQTVYADRPGSVAAPTAGLHFTGEVLSGLEDAGVSIAAVDLEVGLDTFRPIATASLLAHRIHSERFALPVETAEAIEQTRRRRGRVVAVGTTVVRVLETEGRDDGTVAPATGDTALFIRPGYRFKVVDLVLTNFHLPRTTLIALVAAFMGPSWREAYRAALQRGYRFLSFGDGMLAERTT